jgi:steroid delta-isomerase-like uncharacterized protein
MPVDEPIDRLPGRAPLLDEHGVIGEDRLEPILTRRASPDADHDRQFDRWLPAPRARRNVGLATPRQEATMSLTGTDMSRVASELISAFNNADWDRLRTLIAPDLSYAENGTRRTADSADAYLDLLKATKQAFPDLTGTTEATATNDDTIAQRILWEGTHTGVLEIPGWPGPSGNRIRVVCSAWSRFDGDTIHEIHNHSDAPTLREQIGTTTD